MNTFDLHPFAGLETSVGNPNGKGCQNGKNFVRNRIRGYLQEQVGYGKLFASVPVPVADTLRKVSAVNIKDIHSFYVPDHGGQTIQIATGTYTKTSHGYSSPTVVNSVGIWIRPYWNGAAWTDSWFELTEFYIFKLASFTGSTITITNTAGDDLSFLATNALANFTIAFNNFTNTVDNLELIVTSQAAAAQFTFFGASANWSTRVGGDLMYVFRSPFNKMMPTSLASHIHSLRSEARFTTGPASTDIVAAIFFRTKTFGFTQDGTLDAAYTEPACFDLPDTAWKQVDLAKVAAPTGGLPIGTWQLATSLVHDNNDAQESELRIYGGTASTVASEVLLSDAFSGITTSIISDGTYLYFGATGKIYKMDRTTLAIVGSYSLIAGVTPVSLEVYNGILYITAYSASAISVIALSTDTMTTSGTQYSYAVALIPKCSCRVGQYIYYVAFDGAFYAVWKWDTATRAVITNVLLTDTNPPTQIVSDGTSLYINANGATIVSRVLISTMLEQAQISGFDSSALGMTFLGTKVFCLTVMSGNLYAIDTTSHTIGAALVNISNPGTLGNDGTNLFARTAVTFYELTTAGATVTSCSVTSATSLSGLLFVDAGFMYLTVGTNKVAKYSYGSGTALSTDGYEDFSTKVMVSPGLIPRRSQSLRLYAQLTDENNVTGPWQWVKDIDLTTSVFDASAFWDSTSKHHYYKLTTAVTLTAAEWATALTLGSALSNLNRSVTDKGIANYSFGLVHGNVQFLAGARLGSTYYLNKIITSIQHGVGIPQFDVFSSTGVTSGGSNILDVEYNDGDQVVSIGIVGERVLVLKKRSIVLLTPDGVGGYDRTIVTKGVGIASAKTLVSFDDYLVWLDYSGFWMFSTNGIEFIGAPIQEEIRTLAAATKEAAFGILERSTKTYRCTLNSVEYVFDFMDKNWMKDTLTDLPTAYCVSTTDGTPLFLSGTTPNQSIFNLGSDTRHNAVNFTMQYECSDIDPMNDETIDYILNSVNLDYKSDIPITVEVFLDDSGSAQTPALPVAPAANNEAILYTNLSTRCRKWHIRLSATTTGASQKIQIRKVSIDYQAVPGGGDVKVI